MASGQKKVVIRRFTGPLAWGYLPQGAIVQGDRAVLMTVDGRVTPIFLSEIKTIAYVHDFNLDDAVDPERIGRRSFLARPRGDGLWLKVTFLDGEVTEGLTAFGLALLDDLMGDRGFFLTPPEGRSNTQRLFVPRTAVRSLEVLGYVTSPSRRAAKTTIGSSQPSLFDDSVE